MTLYLYRSMLNISLLLLLLLSGRNYASSITHMDCKQVEGLCPGRFHEISCTADSDALLFQQIQMKADQCDKIEADFMKDQRYNRALVECTDHGDMCGRVCGTLKQSDPDMIINMNFTANSKITNWNVTCYGFTSHIISSSSCIITFADFPHPPVNIRITMSEDSNKTYVHWDVPKLYHQADMKMTYRISVKSLITNDTLVNEFNLEEQSFGLPQNLGIAISYAICVTAVNCVGTSEPICTNIILGDNKSAHEILKVNILNSTAVGLILNPLYNNPLQPICYDIETDSNNEVKCVSYNNSIIPIGQGINRIYNIRIRTRIADLVGEWSDPLCVLVSAAPSISIYNYTTVSNNANITTVNILVKIHQLTEFISNCHTIFPNKLQFIIDASSIMEFEIDEGILEKEITLNLANTTIDSTKVTIMGRAVNDVGLGPEHSYHITL